MAEKMRIWQNNIFSMVIKVCQVKIAYLLISYCFLASPVYALKVPSESAKTLIAQVNLTNKIDDYTEAIRLNPNDSEAYYKRGKALGELKDYRAAIEDYNQAIKINPNDGNYYYWRGTARS